MNRSLGIHTVYTPTNRRGTHKIHDMMQFEALTMILSALYWKRHQDKLKLYCDVDFYNYISKLGIIKLWDEIDTISLAKGMSANVNHDTFWAYAKMYVNSIQTEPFVSLDIDLFQEQYYDYTTHDVICSHIEVSDYQKDKPTNFGEPVYYPNYHEWDMFKDRFTEHPNLKFNDEALNVAVLAVNNLDFYKDLMKVVDSFVINNNFDPQDITTHGYERIMSTIHSSSLITFVEQRMASAIARSNGYSVKSIMDLKYDGGSQGWIGDTSTMANPGITHLWGWKTSYRLPEHEQDRLDLTDALLHRLKMEFPQSYHDFIVKGNITKLCKR